VTYYDLFEVPRTASADEIKRAFRREIAKYHPDKVQHLGKEFQEIAVVKAAELTQAYKILSDGAARAEYDEMLDAGIEIPTSRGIPVPPSPSGAQPAPAEPVHKPSEPHAPKAGAHPHPSPGAAGVFSEERAGARDLVFKATLARFRKAVEAEFRCVPEAGPGFDVVCLPDKRLPWHRLPPQIMGRFLPQVDGAAITETWAAAARLRKDPQQRELCVFLMGPVLSSPSELAVAIAEQRRKPLAAGTKPLVLIPVNTRNWNAHVPTDAPAVVKALLARLKSS
jgi:hypothetical protein